MSEYDYQAVVCPSCGIVSAITSEFADVKRRTGDGFFCPNGHTMVYNKKDTPEVEKLKREIVQLKHQIEVLEAQLAEAQVKR